MEWTDETITRLKTLWAEGLSTAEIGRRLNISKNAVVGKAHRINLPSRPSPIRQVDADDRSRPAPPKRVQGPTLPPLFKGEQIETRPAAPVISIVPRKPLLRCEPCCWPIGTPGKESFHYCNADSEPGKPYCEEHAAIAYVRVTDRREDVA